LGKGGGRFRTEGETKDCKEEGEGLTELRQEEHEGHEWAGRFFDGINKIYRIMKKAGKIIEELRQERIEVCVGWGRD
jgi:uncharacterized coiled-coil DUF342 family protein